MLSLILQSLWFFGPAGMANMAPIIVKPIPFLQPLNKPIDFGKKFRGKRIFGSHKTFRGFIAGFVFAVITAYAQLYLYREVVWVRDNLALFDYTTIHPIIWGFICSQGALWGDAIESFFKRQTNHPPGTNWFPFDQIDFIVGTLIATFFVVQLSIQEYVAIAVIVFLLHPTINFIAYLLRLKEHPI